MNIFRTIYKSAKIRYVIAVCGCVWSAALLQLAVQAVSTGTVDDIMEAFSVEDNMIIENCSIESTACLDVDRQYFTEQALLLNTQQTGLPENIKIPPCMSELISAMDHAGYGISPSDIRYRVSPVPCYYINCENDLFRLSVTLSKAGSKEHIYLHVTADKLKNMETYKACRDAVGAYYDNILSGAPDTDYIVYSRINGAIPGKLNVAECRILADRIFKRLGADIINEGSDIYYTRYGYVPSLPGKLTASSSVNGKNVNIQLVCSYNETKGMTEVILGTPFINIPY